jgi:hypothetical protein
MTKRDLIRALLDGQKPPYISWLCGFTKEARAKLQAYFFVPAHDMEVDVSLENILSFIELTQHQPGYRD